MRRNTSYGNGYNGYNGYNPHGNYTPYGTVAITNTYVTNVTNVVAHPYHVGKKHHWNNKHSKKFRHHEKKPKLLRFCASGGLLDQDVAASMSDGELFSGGLAVAGYGFRGAAKHARNIGRCVEDMGRGLYGIGQGVCSLLDILHYRIANTEDERFSCQTVRIPPYNRMRNQIWIRRLNAHLRRCMVFKKHEPIFVGWIPAQRRGAADNARVSNVFAIYGL